MITDPKTAPRGARARLVYAVSVGLLAALLIAPTRTEYATKVALLGALAIVCAARPLVGCCRSRVRLARRAPRARGVAAARRLRRRARRRRACRRARRPRPARGRCRRALPPITIAAVARRPVAARPPTARRDRARPRRGRAGRGVRATACGSGSSPARARTRRSRSRSSPGTHATGCSRSTERTGRWRSGSDGAPQPAAPLAGAACSPGYRLTNVARAGRPRLPPGRVPLRHVERPAGDDGRRPLLARLQQRRLARPLRRQLVRRRRHLPDWQAHGGLPRTQLFRQRPRPVRERHGARRAPGLPIRGEGCVAADLNGDGHTDLYVTTATNDVLLWNNGNGTFTEGARKAGVVSFGWHSGAAVADVNGDGRPDLFVAGYTNMNAPDRRAPSKGFPTNHRGRARPALPERGQPDSFREVGVAGRARPAAVRPQPRRRLHRRQRRRAARPLRRERRGPEPALPERAGRPARVPLRRRARARGVADRERRHGHRERRLQRRRQPDLFVTQLARPDARRLREREADAVRRRAHGVHVGARHVLRRLGRLVGRPRTTTASSTSCSRTARSPSRTSRRTRARSRSLAQRRTATSSTPASLPRIARRTAAASPPPTTTTTAASTSPSTRSAASSSCSTTRARSGHWLEVQRRAVLARSAS